MKVVSGRLKVIALVDLAGRLAPASLLLPLLLHLFQIRKCCNLPFCEELVDHTYHFPEDATSSTNLKTV